jgi:putative redox protein
VNNLDAKVSWKGNLSFDGSADSGFTTPLGARKSVGGDEDGFRPMELFAIGLAGCTAMDVISILGKKRQEVTSFEVQVHAKRAQEHPKVFTSAVIEYYVSGHNIEEKALLRSMELSATRYCPAQAMMGQWIPIQLKYYLYEDMGDGGRKEIANGTYVPTVDVE